MHKYLNNISIIQTRIFSGGPRWKWNSTIPNYYNFWYAMSGTGKISINNGRELSINPGALFVLQEGDRVHAMSNPDTPVVNFSIHWNFKKTPKHNPFPIYGLQMSDPLMVNQMAEKINQTLYLKGKLNQYIIEDSVQWLLSLAERDANTSEPSVRDDKILHLVEIITQSPQRDWSLLEMAEEIKLSPNQMARRFKALTGYSPNLFLIQTRLNNAVELLRYSNLSIEEIAESLGYNDVYFFSRQFKAKMGISPLKYRKSK